ncbi:MAG: glutaredoxin family protein [Candidatus Methylumidiphilus sp.]
MPHLTLYHTAGCHLCEEAETLVLDCLAERGQPADSLRLSDIADSAELSERYGVSIPVLREDASGRELHWPFAAEAVRAFCAGNPR